MNVHLPERNGHRTTSKMIWKGAEIDDYDAKSILLEKLKPKDQDVAILKPLEYLRIAEVSVTTACHKRQRFNSVIQSSMLEVIAYADRDEAIQQEKLSWFGERILSPSIKMETCSPRMKREMAENFRHEFLESKEESVLHFNVLSDEVTNFLMHYVFRHSVPEVVWRRKDYGNVQISKKEKSTLINLTYSSKICEERRRRKRRGRSLRSEASRRMGR